MVHNPVIRYKNREHRFAGFLENHDASPVNVFNLPARSGVLNFGVELELGTFSQNAMTEEVWNRVGPLAVSKYDSSITGVEVVSAPLTLRPMMSYLDRLLSPGWRDVCDTHEAPDEYGMHVHVSENVIPLPVVERIQDFLSDPRHQHYMTWVAGRCTRGGSYNNLLREETAYCRVSIADLATFARSQGWELRTDASGQKYWWGGHDRVYYVGHPASITSIRLSWEDISKYSRMGIRERIQAKRTSGFAPWRIPPTHEVRFFASTFSATRAKANVQFVDALVKFFTKFPTGSPLTLSDYIARHPKRYADMLQRLQGERPRLELGPPAARLRRNPSRRPRRYA